VLQQHRWARGRCALGRRCGGPRLGFARGRCCGGNWRPAVSLQSAYVTVGLAVREVRDGEVRDGAAKPYRSRCKLSELFREQ
jgi:hypothetical protein